MIILASSFLVFMRAFSFNLISERIARNLRDDLYESIMRKDVSFFDERKTGDLLSRINSDISVIQDGLSSNVSMFIRSVIFLIGTIGFLFFISWNLTLVTLACIAPIVVFTVFFGKA